ncbi:MAG: vanadium-dependent haloperoxidase, partial [Gammaproteobacteria bacterium]
MKILSKVLLGSRGGGKEKLPENRKDEEKTMRTAKTKGAREVVDGAKSLGAEGVMAGRAGAEGVYGYTSTARSLSRVVVVALVLAAGLFLPQPVLAGNAVTRWMDLALRSVAAQNVGTPNAGRLYAMVTMAMYDAINGINTANRHGRQHALVPPLGAPVGGARRVAAAAAAHTVLVNPQVGLSAARKAELDAALNAGITAAGGLDNQGVVDGRDWGVSVGQQVVSQRATDGTQSAETIPAGSECGVFRASWDARWRNMTAFGVDDLTQFPESPAPPALTNSEYTEAFNDVKTCGSDSPILDLMCADPTTPAERAEISSFWQAESGTVRETGIWFLALAQIVEQEDTVASLSRTARLFALVGMAIADAVRSSWRTKHAYNTWRPFHVIREASRDDLLCDGNPNTIGDAFWQPRIFPSIGGTPEWDSGLSTFAGAASSVIMGFYGNKYRISPFCFDTFQAGPSEATMANAFGPPTTSAPRCYDTASQGRDEAGRSRIFQGIHFQFSNQNGLENGEAIGAYIERNRLRR